MVARPGVLYIADVPVFWLPFIFQDLRSGRRSGVLTPRFGVSDIVRNSPSYRRQVEGLGYYWAISDYLDAQASFDWRSSADAQYGDTEFKQATLNFRQDFSDAFRKDATLGWSRSEIFFAVSMRCTMS